MQPVRRVVYTKMQAEVDDLLFTMIPTGWVNGWYSMCQGRSHSVIWQISDIKFLVVEQLESREAT